MARRLCADWRSLEDHALIPIAESAPFRISRPRYPYHCGLRKTAFYLIKEPLFAFMSTPHQSNGAVDLLGKFLFPGVRRSSRRKHLRFLLLSLLLGLLCCLCLGGMLYLMYTSP